MTIVLPAVAVAAACALAGPVLAQSVPPDTLSELPRFPVVESEPARAWLALSPDGEPAIASIANRFGAVRLSVPRDGDYWLVVEGGMDQADPANVRLFPGGDQSVTLPPCRKTCSRKTPLALTLREGDLVEITLPRIVVTGGRLQR